MTAGRLAASKNPEAAKIVKVMAVSIHERRLPLRLLRSLERRRAWHLRLPGHQRRLLESHAEAAGSGDCDRDGCVHPRSAVPRGCWCTIMNIHRQSPLPHRKTYIARPRIPQRVPLASTSSWVINKSREAVDIAPHPQGRAGE